MNCLLKYISTKSSYGYVENTWTSFVQILFTIETRSYKNYFWNIAVPCLCKWHWHFKVWCQFKQMGVFLSLWLKCSKVNKGDFNFLWKKKIWSYITMYNTNFIFLFIVWNTSDIFLLLKIINYRLYGLFYPIHLVDDDVTKQVKQALHFQWKKQ